MYCQNCGAELTGTEKFCGECGTKVEFAQYQQEKINSIIEKQLDFQEKEETVRTYIQGNKSKVSEKKLERFYIRFLTFFKDNAPIVSWNTGAFFFTSFYFFYRKCYLAGIITFMIQTFFFYIKPTFLALYPFVCAFFANYFIFVRYKKLAEKSESLGDEEARLEFLKKKGGTGKAWILEILVIVLFSLLV